MIWIINIRITPAYCGDVKGVIRGLRRMGSIHKLEGEAAADYARIAGYLEKHAERMEYDEHLAMGYTICSGVIEGRFVRVGPRKGNRRMLKSAEGTQSE